MQQPSAFKHLSQFEEAGVWVNNANNLVTTQFLNGMIVMSPEEFRYKFAPAVAQALLALESSPAEIIQFKREGV